MARAVAAVRLGHRRRGHRLVRPDRPHRTATTRRAARPGRLRPPTARTAAGSPQPRTVSASGRSPTQVHALGLKFGLHIMRGIPRLAVELDLPVYGHGMDGAGRRRPRPRLPVEPGQSRADHDHPGAQAYYDAQVAQFAEWGVDFVKADDMLAPYHDREIEAYAQAIERSGRDIVLSLVARHPPVDASRRPPARARAACGGSPTTCGTAGRTCTRSSRDWPAGRRSSRPAAGPTRDMLPLGRIGIRAERGDDRDSRLTARRTTTLLTLWVMARSPLMIGRRPPHHLPAKPSPCWRIRRSPRFCSRRTTAARSSANRWTTAS